MTLTPRLLLPCLVIAAAGLSGCHMFSKSSKPKEDSSHLSDEVENTFKTRWVEKRSGELVAQGQTADAARAQATQEFKDKYEYTGAAQK